MRESELLAHIYQRSAGMAAGPVVVGPGDDCAVVELQGKVLLTVDHLIEGRHFSSGMQSTSPDQVARKAVARSISDIAAMGGTPVCALAAASLPPACKNANDLFDAVHRWAAHWHCPVVGGDIAISEGPLVLSITAVGTAHRTRGPVLRSAAQPGDHVYVTGRLGGSFASGRHLSFEPRLEEARWLCDLLGDDLHAMMDLSDGLGRDSGRLALASGVAVELDADRIPLHSEVSSWKQGVTEGEDYELLFCVAPHRAFPAVITNRRTQVHRVGTVAKGSRSWVLLPEGDRIEVSDMGWDHRA